MFIWNLIFPVLAGILEILSFVNIGSNFAAVILMKQKYWKKYQNDTKAIPWSKSGPESTP